MTITTERRIPTTSLDASRGRTRSTSPARRRATAARRRYVLASVPQGAAQGAPGACVDRAHRDEKISWVAMVAGVVGTALVILGLVAVANLRAGSIEPEVQPASVSSVSQSQGQQTHAPSLP